MATRVCKTCGEVKSRNDFSKQKSNKDGFSLHCKSCKAIYGREYRAKNRSEVLRRQREKRRKNKDEINKRVREDRANNPNKYKVYDRRSYLNNIEKKRLSAKKYREKNREKIKKANKRWRDKNKEKVRENNKRWKEKNKDRVRELSRLYRERNRDKLNSQLRERHRVRVKEDEMYKLIKATRSNVHAAFKRSIYNKNTSTSDLLGISWDKYKLYLESMFSDEMNWDNYGSYWNIDHIYPLSLARDEDELYGLLHYRNTRPMISADNSSKNNKIVNHQLQIKI